MIKADAVIADQPALISPGDVLRKDYVARGRLTQDQLASAMGVSRFSVNQLLNDRRNVTAEMALRLARVLGTSPEFWLDLQRDVDLERARRRKGAEIEALSPLEGPAGGPPLASVRELFAKED